MILWNFDAIEDIIRLVQKEIFCVHYAIESYLFIVTLIGFCS